MLYPNKIKYLIVHCSDTPDNDMMKAIDIHKMHLGFGWNGIGYHKIIRRDGTIENGRPEYWGGAHVKGFNQESLGVCLIGRKNFKLEQFNSLEKVLLVWKKKYSQVQILGHRDVVETHKTCPNFNVNNWCKERGLI